MSYLCGFEFEGNRPFIKLSKTQEISVDNFIYNNIVKYIAKRIYL